MADTSAGRQVSPPRAQRHWCLAVFGFVIVGRVEDALADDTEVVDAQSRYEQLPYFAGSTQSNCGVSVHPAGSIESTRAVVSGALDPGTPRMTWWK